MAVVAVDHRQARAHEAGEVEGRDTGTKGEGSKGVAQVVDAPARIDPGLDLGRRPYTCAEVAQVEVAAARRGKKKWCLPIYRCSLERIQRNRLEGDGAPAA